MKIATAMLTKGQYPEKNKGDNDFSKHFIPKSKIEKKIGELKQYYEKEVYRDRYQWDDIDITQFYCEQISLLQELMEDK